MKLSVLVTLVIFAVTIGSASHGTAGPAVTSGPAQPDSGGAVYAPTTLQNTSGVSPGVNANNNLAASSSGTSQPAGPTTSSTNSTASGSGTNSAPNQSAGESSGRSASASAPSVNELKQEKVVEVSVKDLAAERAKNQNKSEVTKKFESSLLDQGIDKIAKPETDSSKRNAAAAEAAGAQQNQAATHGQNSPDRNDR